MQTFLVCDLSVNDKQLINNYNIMNKENQKCCSSPLWKVACLLTVVGGLNWGLVAFNFNLVEAILPMGLAKVVYGLVGLSGLMGVCAIVSKSCKK